MMAVSALPRLPAKRAAVAAGEQRIVARRHGRDDDRHREHRHGGQHRDHCRQHQQQCRSRARNPVCPAGIATKERVGEPPRQRLPREPGDDRPQQRGPDQRGEHHRQNAGIEHRGERPRKRAQCRTECRFTRNKDAKLCRRLD